MAKLLLYTLAVVLTFAALTWWRASAREAQAEANYPPEGEIINVGGQKVHAVVRGAGPDLVLIHGASGSTRDMTFELAGLLAQRYRVIVMDRPGFGYTPRLHASGETLREQADLLSRAAASLGADAPIVMGQSYGGAVALAWASRFPDRLSALVAVAAASNPWATPLDPLYRVTSSWLGAKLVVPILTAWVPQSYVEGAVDAVFAPQSSPDGYADYFGADMTLRRETMVANARQRANLLQEIKDQAPEYSNIAVPTEIVHGTADTTVGLKIHSEPLARQVADANLVALDGIGHMPQHVAQSEVIAAIDRAAERARLR